MQGDGFASELGAIMEVAMLLCAPLLIRLSSSLDLVPKICCVGSRQVKVGVRIICKVVIHEAYGLV
jgi:hypothetical protein